VAKEGDQFANGRSVRRLFEDVHTNQANRLVAAGNQPTADQLCRIKPDDLLTASAGGIL
jgi:hypothetical protein